MSKTLDDALDLMDEGLRRSAIERLSIALVNVRHFLDDLDFEEHGKVQRHRLLCDIRSELAAAEHTVEAIRLAEGLPAVRP